MRSVAVAILAAVMPAGAAWASTFTAVLNTNSTTGSTPVFLSGSGPEYWPGSAFTGFSYAGSFVGVTGSASSPGGDINAVANVFTQASNNITDLIISGPGAMVPVTITLPFLATITGNYTMTTGGNSNFTGGIELGTNWGTPTSIDLSVLDNTYNVAEAGAGWLVNLTPTDNVTTSPGVETHDVSFTLQGELQLSLVLPVNTPLSAQFGVIGNCGAGG